MILPQPQLLVSEAHRSLLFERLRLPVINYLDRLLNFPLQVLEASSLHPISVVVFTRPFCRKLGLNELFLNWNCFTLQTKCW